MKKRIHEKKKRIQGKKKRIQGKKEKISCVKFQKRQTKNQSFLGVGSGPSDGNHSRPSYCVSNSGVVFSSGVVSNSGVASGEITLCPVDRDCRLAVYGPTKLQGKRPLSFPRFPYHQPEGKERMTSIRSPRSRERWFFLPSGL